MKTNYHLTEEQIAACADAIIDGKYSNLNQDIRNHLAECDECAAEVLNVTEISIDFSAGSSTKGLFIKFKPWIIATASIAAAGALLLIAFNATVFSDSDNVNSPPLALENADNHHGYDEPYSTRMSDTSETRLAQEKDSAKRQLEDSIKQKVTEKKESKTELKEDYLLPYGPNETLEKLFNNFTQAYRGEDITITSKGVTKIPEADSLKWSNPNGEELYVEFFNNKGHRINTLTVNSAGIPLPELDKGLYYWKLINNDFDLLFVGKIIVE
ncbi:MAG: hypothetical protein ACLFNU_07835 [Bacteroidales bacterium]